MTDERLAEIVDALKGPGLPRGLDLNRTEILWLAAEVQEARRRGLVAKANSGVRLCVHNWRLTDALRRLLGAVNAPVRDRFPDHGLVYRCLVCSAFNRTVDSVVHKPGCPVTAAAELLAEAGPPRDHAKVK